MAAALPRRTLASLDGAVTVGDGNPSGGTAVPGRYARATVPERLRLGSCIRMATPEWQCPSGWTGGGELPENTG